MYAWVALKTWKGFASAGLVVLVVFVAGLVNHAPTFPYEYQYGHNARPHARMAEDAERYGLKIAQLVLPVAQHNPVGVGDDVWFDPAAIRSMYQAPSFKELNESEWDPIGLVAAVGYVLLLASAVVPVRRRWPVGPLAALDHLRHPARHPRRVRGGVQPARHLAGALLQPDQHLSSPSSPCSSSAG